IQARIQAHQSSTSPPEQDQAQSHSSQTTVKLTDFIGDEHKDQPEGIAFSYLDYLELVDWSGRAIRDDKAGAIADNLPPILARLGIEQQGWLDMINHYDQRFFRAVGAMDKLKQFAHRLGQCWMKGQSADKCVYKQTLPT
ncbi:MAG: transposase, partial [Gammaproteobacteria bacterium]|nr:transposase [Gammaproteobacteria bacterium]